jgi:Protein of unknown function (DUF3352)
MTDQNDAGLTPQADANLTPEPTAPPPAVDGSTVQATAIPPTRPDQPLTAAPAAGADWGSTPAPAGWSTQGGLDFAAAPVQAVPAPARGRRGLRWLVAAAIVVLVAASASAVFFVVAGAASPSTVARWAPSDSILYMEARFDLPGDQHAKAGQFLAAFPGFADPASLDAKLAELYDKAIKSASDGGSDYSTDVKAWFGGQVALSLSAFPAGAMGMGGASDINSARGAFLLSVTDAAKASAWLTKAAGSSGTAATYGGVALTVFGSGASAGAIGVDDAVLIGGDVATVHAIIDAKGNDGLAATADFKKALANSPKDRVGFMFMQTQKFIDAEMSGMPAGATGFPKEMLAQIPAWAGGSALFESDSIVFDEVAPFPTGISAPADRTSTIAGHLPASTVAEFEGHDVGKAINDAIKLYQATPATKDAVTKVLDALDKAGGLDSYTSWLGDAAVAVTVDGGTVGGGVVVTLKDKTASDAASAKFASLKNLVSLAGLPGAKVTSEDHAGATITTIDLGSIKDLQGLVPGMDSGLSMGSLPASVADARIALSYAVTGDLAVIGVGGDGFVKAVLDTKAGSSLADQPRYKTAMGRAGASNSSQGFVDVAAIVKAVEAQLPSDTLKSYEKDTKPYLAPFAAFGYSTQGGDLQHVRFVVTVSK